MRSFPDNAYRQDVIAPVRLEHRVDFGDRDGAAEDRFGYEYNFLVYEFAEDEASAEAVHYMDQPDAVDLRVVEPPGLTSDFAQRVLVFLTMRYGTVNVPGEADRYRPMPPAIADAVRARRVRHMARMSD